MRVGLERILLGAVMSMFFAAVATPADCDAGKRAFEKGDYATALKKLTPLAAKGNAEAQSLLGLMYDLGKGLPRDTDQALRWYKAAADQGSAAGEFHLGTIYLNGAGAVRDTVQGLKWLTLAANQGLSDAALVLGMAYMNLKDFPHDFVKADMWLRVAAARGDSFAAGQRARLETHMTRAEIAQSESLAAAWRPLR